MTTTEPQPTNMSAPRRSSDLRFTLRPYQDEAIERSYRAEARGVRSQLGVAATGLGKTVIFCAFAQARGGRTLILAHRDELVSQARAKVLEVWPDADVGIVKAGDNDVDAHVVVASVQTLAREKRMQQLLDAQASMLRPCDPFDLVVVDEAHHAAAESYRFILDALGAGQDDGPLLLGVTATPDRGDGKGLDDLFDEVVWNYDLLWGIRSGFLADVRAKRLVLDRLDLSGVKVRRGDYDAGQAGRALEDANAPEYIVKGWTEHASDRQTIVFTPTVAMADSVAAAFRHAGVRAAMVSGETPLDERRAILRDYATGHVQVVANCAVLTEGFDDPATSCIVMARPTKSRALFTQMVGRGTRRYPDKDHLLVLDVVGGSEQHSLVTVPSLFGIPEPEQARLETQNLTDAVDEIEAALVAAGKLRAEEANLFAKVRSQGIAWIHAKGRHDRERRYRRTLPDGMPTVVLVQRDTENPESWLAGLHYERTGEKRVLIADVEFDLAQGVGEDAARKLIGRRSALIDTNAAWRRKKPTKRQKIKARSLDIDPSAYTTAGDLSDAIDLAVAEQREHAHA